MNAATDDAKTPKISESDIIDSLTSSDNPEALLTLTDLNSKSNIPLLTGKRSKEGSGSNHDPASSEASPAKRRKSSENSHSSEELIDSLKPTLEDFGVFKSVAEQFSDVRHLVDGNERLKEKVEAKEKLRATWVQASSESMI